MKLGDQIRIKPASGIKLRKPDGQLLAAEGEIVVANSYWFRRLQDGDIEEIADVQEPSVVQTDTKTKG